MANMLKSPVRPAYEKLIPPVGESFRCFNRRTLRTPAKWHRHPEIELTFVERGAGSRLVGDHIGSYRDGDLVLLGSELPHTWLSDAFRNKSYDRHPAIVIQFHPEFLGHNFFGVTEMMEVSNMLDRARRGLWFPPSTSVPIGVKLTQMLDLTPARRLIALLSCLEELSSCSDAVPLARGSYVVSANATGESRIQMVCDYIAQELTDSTLDHSKLARLAAMNPSAFSRFFKKTTGRTVSAYITELRIGLACRLLRDTDDSILEISLKSGFANLSNFNRRFRQHREMTPRNFRARYTEARDSTFTIR